jgi:hypothetical protein
MSYELTEIAFGAKACVSSHAFIIVHRPQTILPENALLVIATQDVDFFASAPVDARAVVTWAATEDVILDSVLYLQP